MTHPSSSWCRALPTPPPSRRRRPPLADLHAFEVAARHLSFTRAAAELALTQGAVSQRVKALEDALGVQLFERLTRALALTPAGAALAARVRDGLARIDDGLAAIGPGPAGDVTGTLVVSVLPSFAGRWLLPRLGRFQALHPEVAVRIVAEDRLADLAAGGVDLGIRFGRGVWRGLQSTLLMEDMVFPVCSPALLARGPPLETPDALTRHVLLHDAVAERDGSGCAWVDWMRSAGLMVPCEAGPRFSQAHLTVQAAAEGLGVALARASLVGGDIAEGRLVRVFAHAARTSFSYHLVRPAKAPSQPCAAAFTDWLVDEAAAWLTSEREARHRYRPPGSAAGQP